MHFLRNHKNTAVDIDDIEHTVCKTLIENFHEQISFDTKTYCRGMSNVITPTKITPKEPATTPSKSPASSKERKENENKATENKIPGLPDKDFKKSKKKENKGKQSSE